MIDDLAEAKRHIERLIYVVDLALELVAFDGADSNGLPPEYNDAKAFLDAKGQPISLQNLSVLEAMQKQFGPSPDGALERDIASVREGQRVEGGEDQPLALTVLKEILSRQYEWVVDCDGIICGLVAGDMGYDRSGLNIKDLLFAALAAVAHEGRETRQWPKYEALQAALERLIRIAVGCIENSPIDLDAGAELTRLKSSQADHDRTVRLEALEEAACAIDAAERPKGGFHPFIINGFEHAIADAVGIVRALMDQTGQESGT